MNPFFEQRSILIIRWGYFIFTSIFIAILFLFFFIKIPVTTRIFATMHPSNTIDKNFYFLGYIDKSDLYKIKPNQHALAYLKDKHNREVGMDLRIKKIRSIPDSSGKFLVIIYPVGISTHICMSRANNNHKVISIDVSVGSNTLYECVFLRE